MEERISGLEIAADDGRDEAGTAPPLWAPPRRRRGGRTTPLGFAAGDPCPRICGGILDEREGAFHCTLCDFRYPGAVEPVRDGAGPERAVLAPGTGDGAARQVDPGPECGAEPPQRDGGEAASEETAAAGSPPAPAPLEAIRLAHAREIQSLKARSEEAVREVEERLQREIESLEDANRRLLQMVYDLVNGQAPSGPVVGLREGPAPDGIPPEESAAGPRPRWWQRLRR